MADFEERCTPKLTGLAADVDRLLAAHSSGPRRFPVPEKPGVYKLNKPGMEHLFVDEMAQLTEEGQWWPYPFIFSGWRASEISLFETTPLPHLTMDVPEIPDPELSHRVDDLSSALKDSFPEISDARIREFALGYLQD